MMTFATLFDRRYMAKGLALLASMSRHLPNWRAYILALDEITFQRLGMLAKTPQYSGHLYVTALQTIEDDALRTAKRNRTWREYIFTLTPAWTAYVLSNAAIDDLAYIDADIYLFSDLAPLYAEVGAASIGIIPHRWTPRHADRLRANGIYNVGWVYFRHDGYGITCLEKWLSDCLAYAGPLGKFSDQVYLDEWPALYGPACHIVDHRGVNVAPWNVERYTFQQPPSKDAVYVIDESDISWVGLAMGIVAPRAWPLLMYHFHELRLDPGGIYRTGYPLSLDAIELVYKPYEAELRNAN